MSINLSNRTPLIPAGLFRSAYSEKIKVAIEFEADSPHTRQEFKEECDINNIMAQYLVTGEFTHLNESLPQYLDCSEADFRAHMDYVAGAYSMFEELPSAVRTQFDNDPALFLDFCSHEKNRPELAEMGLLTPEAVSRLKTPSPSPTASFVPPAAPTAAPSAAPAPPSDPA